MTGHASPEPVLPLLGLALTRRPPDAALPLLVALHEWCLPATLDPAAGTPTAVIATVEGLHLAPADVLVALWAQTEDVDTEAFRAADVVISDQAEVVGAAGRRGLTAPTGRHIGPRRPMSPFVRERLRRERGLPADALLEWHEAGWLFGPAAKPKPLADDLVETALAAAAAVVVTDVEWLHKALAWGAPTVTSAVAAEALGLIAPDQVVVAGTPADRRTAAAALIASPVDASRVSWGGFRRLERLDAERAAVVLVERLRLWPDTPPRPAPPLPTVELTLRLLGTPADAHVRTRLSELAGRLTTV